MLVYNVSMLWTFYIYTSSWEWHFAQTFSNVCLISGSWQRPNSSYHLHWENNELGAWLSNWGIPRKCLLSKSYSLCFWCCRRPRRKYLLCFRKWTAQSQKVLERQNSPSEKIVSSEIDAKGFLFSCFERYENKPSGKSKVTTTWKKLTSVLNT